MPTDKNPSEVALTTVQRVIPITRIHAFVDEKYTHEKDPKREQQIENVMAWFETLIHLGGVLVVVFLLHLLNPAIHVPPEALSASTTEEAVNVLASVAILYVSAEVIIASAILLHANLSIKNEK